MNPQNPQDQPPQIPSQPAEAKTTGLKPGAEITFSQREIAKVVGLDPEKASEAELFNAVQKRSEGEQIDVTSIAEAKEFERLVDSTFINRMGAPGKFKYKVVHIFPQFANCDDGQYLAMARVLKFIPGEGAAFQEELTMSCKQFTKEFKVEA